jgi:ABC-type Fe3+/spermidine/putrescine transport system ATPase subunit
MAVGDRLAVLRDGIVEQIGSSDELYNHPRNSFVANFIGKMNFFNGTVGKGNERDSLPVILIGGLKLSVRWNNIRLGRDPVNEEAVLVAARPEQLRVTPWAAGDPGVDGEITIIQHLGHIVRYEVQVSEELSRTTLEVDMDGLVPNINEHDRVKVIIDVEKAVLYDREGER